MNIKKPSNIVGMISITLLIMLVFGLMCPIVGSDVQASELPSDSLVAHAAVDVNPVISIGLDKNELNINLTPQSMGSTDVVSAALSVSTNNIHGYKILLSGTHDGKLIQNGTEISINPLTSTGQKLSEFSNNTWGYSITNELDSNTTFSPLTGSATVAKNVDVASAATADTYKLALAAKIDTTLPAGTYHGIMVVSAVANPITITSMDQLFFMQDITPELCANATMEQQRQLTDTRDGKTYWVARLKDGNCWMVQNLALDIPAEGLSATDTDIEEDWNESSKYPPEETERVLGEVDSFRTKSWDLGKYVMSNAEFSNRCSTEGDANYISVSTGSTMTECARVGIIDVSGPEWKPTFRAQWGIWSYNGDQTNINNGITAKPGTPSSYFISVNTETHEYDPHYLTGNYYMFYTATAGHDIDNAVDKIVDASICPKGWRLPSGGAINNEVNGSIFNMLNGYGLTSTNPSTSGTYNVTLSDGNIQEYTVNQNKYNMVHNPLSFLRVGQVYILDNKFATMRWIGSSGMLWTNTIKKQLSEGSANSYFYEFTYGGVQPANIVNSAFGFPIRCLSR